MAARSTPRPTRARNLACALWLLIVGTCGFYALDAEGANDRMMIFPDPIRSEGKITLRYKRKDQLNEHILAFEEITDPESRRSKVKIGYVSYAPNIYYNLGDHILKVDDSGRCGPIERDQGQLLIPELDWFAKMTYTEDELSEGLKACPSIIGPSLLARLPGLKPNGMTPLSIDRMEMHRNIECQVSSSTYKRDKVASIKFEAYNPPKGLFGDTHVPFFTIKETATGLDDGQGGTFDVSFTIDYYIIEQIATDDPIEAKKLEEEFGLPLGAGCSEYLNKLPDPEIEDQSFVMNFHQDSVQALISLAYDNENGYLRREHFPTGTLSIWDLNEDLLYSVDNQASIPAMTGLHNSSLINKNENNEPAASTSTEECSVMHVSDPTLGSALNPHIKQDKEHVFNLLQFLGAKDLAYIARATARGLPCSVYETIVDEAPPVFATNADLQARHKGKFDYIVQFYLLRTSSVAGHLNEIKNEFWPARIALFRRDKASGRIEGVHDQLEVNEFHWSLFGLDAKPSELFFASECFDVEDEQVRIELLIEFKRYGNSVPFGSNEMNRLRRNKYKLELDLLNNLFRLFGISRLHLTDFELTLRPNDAVVNMVISDRKYDKALSYFGLGELPDDNKVSSNNRIVLVDGLDERACVLLASHITDIAMVAYCPYVPNKREASRCVAVINEMEPVIQHESKDSQEAGDAFGSADFACHVYSFSGEAPPPSGTVNWSKWRELLRGHEFSFYVQEREEPRLTYVAKIRSFELERKEQPVVVANYKYLLERGQREADDDGEASTNQQRPPRVRSFPTMDSDTVGDCARLCNLDVQCRSYSFCERASLNAASNQVPKEERCLLSSLDIRDSQVLHQLAFADKLDDGSVVVHGSERDARDEYKLKQTNWCMIHEKDYLDSFGETGEAALAAPFGSKTSYRIEPSATKCAKYALDMEAQRPDDAEASHTMAYCPDSQACLLDSQLFIASAPAAPGEDSNDEASNADNNDETANQSNCLVYRRKYQTFFHVSLRVLKQAEIGDNSDASFSQLPIEMATVEECARACWNQFGHVCASFDYCSSQSLCLINSIALDRPDIENFLIKDKLQRLVEQRAGCLHYERDLRIDQLRRSHAKLRHKALNLALIDGKTSDKQQGQNQAPNRLTFTKIILNFLMFCTVAGSFVAGLALGKFLNGKLGETQLTSSVLNGVANLINSLAGKTRGEQDDTLVLSEHGQDDQELNAIQMEEIRSDGAPKEDASSEGLHYSNSNNNNSHADD